MKQVIEIELDVPSSVVDSVFVQIADWVHAVYPHYDPSCSSRVEMPPTPTSAPPVAPAANETAIRGR